MQHEIGPLIKAGLANLQSAIVAASSINLMETYPWYATDPKDLCRVEKLSDEGSGFQWFTQQVPKPGDVG